MSWTILEMCCKCAGQVLPWYDLGPGYLWIPIIISQTIQSMSWTVFHMTLFCPGPLLKCAVNVLDKFFHHVIFLQTILCVLLDCYLYDTILIQNITVWLIVFGIIIIDGDNCSFILLEPASLNGNLHDIYLAISRSSRFTTLNGIKKWKEDIIV